MWQHATNRPHRSENVALMQSNICWPVWGPFLWGPWACLIPPLFVLRRNCGIVRQRENERERERERSAMLWIDGATARKPTSSVQIEQRLTALFDRQRREFLPPANQLPVIPGVKPIHIASSRAFSSIRRSGWSFDSLHYCKSRCWRPNYIGACGPGS